MSSTATRPEDASPVALSKTATWPPRVRSTTLVVAGFAFLQVVIVGLAANGPFIDEGIYATGGLRVLQGFGFKDAYLSWFNGSPFLWPVFSAAGYALAGLAGSRLMALAFSLVTLGAFARAVENLFGRPAAFWATLGLALNGLFFALAHFAVYDTMALACLCLSFWLITEHLSKRGTACLIAAALSFAVAVMAKYGYVIMGVPLLGLLATQPDSSRRGKAVALFTSLAGLILLGTSWGLFGGPVPGSIQTYLDHPRASGRFSLMAGQAYFIVVPLILAVTGAGFVWRTGRRWLALMLLAALFIAPAFHIVSLHLVSAQKHVVMGFLFAYPLAGVALGKLWASRARWLAVPVLAALAAWGAVQWYAQERSWPEVRPVAAYLLEHVERGETIASCNAWTYAMYLYWNGRVREPFDLQDRLCYGTPDPDPCKLDWLVGESGGWSPAGDPVVQAAIACGHELAFTVASRTIYIDGLGRPRVSTGKVSVYRRAGPRRRETGTRG